MRLWVPDVDRMLTVENTGRASTNDIQRHLRGSKRKIYGRQLLVFQRSRWGAAPERSEASCAVAELQISIWHPLRVSKASDDFAP